MLLGTAEVAAVLAVDIINLQVDVDGDAAATGMSVAAIRAEVGAGEQDGPWAFRCRELMPSRFRQQQESILFILVFW